MKKTFIIMFTLFFFQMTEAGSRVEKCTMHSAILGTDKEYCVYLPEGYDERNDTYPVLYLLHGFGGCCETWEQKYNMRTVADSRIESGFSVPMIIVMPDARGILENRKGKNVGYVNRDGWNYEDYFFKELIPEIETKFRARSDRKSRAISGSSMGGAGTVIYAMHHPEYFSSACPMGARVEGTPGIEPGTGGDKEEFYAYSRANNMVEYLRSQSPERQKEIGTVRWYIECADGDKLLFADVNMYSLMTELKFPVVNLRVREGAHNQEYWHTSLYDVLTFISIGFSR